MKYYIFSLILLSTLTHFIFWGYPKQVVFDEVYFGSFAAEYLAGEYFFDVHPPLGKMIISAFGSLGHVNPKVTFTKINEPFGDSGYLWLRFLPNLAGLLLPLVIFFLCLRLGFSRAASFFAGLFLILENSLLVQSRFILLDSFLLLFGFSGLLFYLLSRKQANIRKKILLLLPSVILLTFAFSVKWTGLAYLGIVGIIEFIDWFRNFEKWHLVDYVYRIIFFMFIPLLIYFSIFAIHFSLLKKSGSGDAFMSPSFQKTLVDNSYQDDPNIRAENIFSRFIELNGAMYVYNKTLSASHPYSSQFYSWPFLWRPIYYWNNSDSNTNNEARIYFIGNPFIYWLSFSAILFLLWAIIRRKFSYQKNKKMYLFLVGCFVLNFFPYIFISRVMFLYHYLTALVFSILALVFVIDKMTKGKQKMTIFIFLAVVFFLSFLFISPLTYGFPLAQINPYQASWWPQTWR